MSNLEKHAESEMRLAGLYDTDADYGGMVPDAVMELVKIHSAQGHSGMSQGLVLSIFNCVVNYKTLTPLNDNPATWVEVSDGMWQSNRRPDAFSKDGGKTWYCLDEPKDERKAAVVSFNKGEMK